MPAQVELEEEVEAVREEQERHALERRERNSLAIAEVVGRNPAKRPSDQNWQARAQKNSANRASMRRSFEQFHN